MSVEGPRLVGLIGHPVGHSRSPVMQQAAFDALGIAARYELWDTPAESLPERVAALRSGRMLGANVTSPHKTAVIALLDAVAPDALRYATAVNTIIVEQGENGPRLVGHNTDLSAIRRVLYERSAWDGGRRMLVLGAGGAAQAALAAALLEGGEVRLAARNTESAHATLEALWRRATRAAPGEPLPAEWSARIVCLTDKRALAAALRETDILVNATPVGTGDPEASPLDPALLRHLPQSAFVFDMVYNPPETALVRAARSAGRRATGGLPMLLYQGADAFTLWTHMSAPLEVMRRALGMEG